MKNKLAAVLAALMIFLALSAPLTAAATGTDEASAADPAASEPAETGMPEKKDRPAAFIIGDGTTEVSLDPVGDNETH